MRNLFATACLLVACFAAVAGVAVASDEFGPEPTWTMPTWQDVRSRVEQYVSDKQLDKPTAEKVMQFWPEQETGPSDSRLDRLVASLASADARIAELVDSCAAAPELPLSPAISWLDTEKTDSLVRDNLRLYYGRYLAQHHLYDESLTTLTGIEPESVVDPAMLLFFRAVAQHQLVEHDAGLKQAQKLLERRDEIPARYRHVAELMEADLERVEPDSLDHIARRMGDVRRRLDLGRAGKRVREIEDGVVASLDKMIEELEKQKQQQQGGAGGGGGQSQPAPDSTPMEGKGPGKVDKKDVGKKSGWGSLPPKQREEAMQEVGKGFPSHYRDAIEQYFRKIASEEGEPR